MGKPIRILLVERDRQEAHRWIRLLQAGNPDARVTVSFGLSAVGRRRRRRPDAVLLDVAGFGCAEPSAVQRIQEAYPRTPILVVANDQAAAQDALGRGASACVLYGEATAAALDNAVSSMVDSDAHTVAPAAGEHLGERPVVGRRAGRRGGPRGASATAGGADRPRERRGSDPQTPA